ncbi:hypothetical protein BH09ACT12_BH09ACT12_10110 [soil metagenome]
MPPGRRVSGTTVRAAASVAPGGVLLVVDHGSAPSWSFHGDDDFPSVEELHACLGLPAEEWQAVRVEAPERTAVGPDGEHGTLTDLVVVLRRAG